MKTNTVPIAILPKTRAKLIDALEKAGWRIHEPRFPAGEYGFEIRDPSGSVAWEDTERPYWPDHVLIYGAISLAVGANSTPISRF